MRDAARAKEIMIMGKADKLYSSMFDAKSKRCLDKFQSEANAMKA